MNELLALMIGIDMGLILLLLMYVGIFAYQDWRSKKKYKGVIKPPYFPGTFVESDNPICHEDSN